VLFKETMTKYPKIRGISRIGVNFTKTLVEKANCIFNETPQQYDLGIDGQIELIINETPTNSIIATQIKSGNSYFEKDKQRFKIPVDNHYEYWKNYPVDVIGIVYIPDLEKAYWIDIKKYFDYYGAVKTIYIYPNRINELTFKTFNNIILLLYSKQIPIIPFNEVALFLKSDIKEEFDIGLISGFTHYSDKNEFWELIVQYLFEKNVEYISNELIYYLSFSTNAVDVWHSPRYKYNQTNLSFAKSLLKEISKENIIKLLSILNSEQTISRGSIGSSIESIVSNADNIGTKLIEIINDKNLNKIIRENAVAIFASIDNNNILERLIEIKHENKDLDIDLIISVVKQFGKMLFYI
jgi:hypothetical protein